MNDTHEHSNMSPKAAPLESPDGSKECVEILNEKISELQAEIENKTQIIARQKEQLEWFRRQMYGQKSERDITKPAETPLLPGIELPAPEPLEPPEDNSANPRPAKPPKDRAKRGTGGTALSYPDNLPRDIVNIELPEDQRRDPVTGQVMQYIGYEVREILVRVPKQFSVREERIFKYANPNRPLAGVIAPSVPDECPILGCSVDVSVISDVIVSKFADHIPLNRQSEIYARENVNISRQTMDGWLMQIFTFCKSLYMAFQKEVLNSAVLFIDEIPVKLWCKGKCSTSYFWSFVGGGGADPPLRLFQFSESRGYENIKKILADFHGSYHSDQYIAYIKLNDDRPELLWQPCMSHVRRKFFEAMNVKPELREKILHYIRRLSMIERIAWNRSPEERLRIRQDVESRVFDKLDALVENEFFHGKHLPKSRFGKALAYYIKAKPYLRNYFKHADMRMENNVAERAVRPCAVGRKNWLFVGSPRGGEAAAFFYSMVQTCRALHVNPFEYFNDILRRISTHPSNRIDELLPHKWKEAREACQADTQNH